MVNIKKYHSSRLNHHSNLAGSRFQFLAFTTRILIFISATADLILLPTGVNWKNHFKPTQFTPWLSDFISHLIQLPACSKLLNEVLALYVYCLIIIIIIYIGLEVQNILKLNILNFNGSLIFWAACSNMVSTYHPSTPYHTKTFL